MKSVLTITNVTEEQIYKEFLRLGMEQLIAQDLSKRYYHNELTYRDLENLEKQFGIKFDNLVFKIDSVEKNLNTKIDNVEKNLDTKIDGIKNEFNAKIDGLNTKIENLNTKIDNVEKNLKQDMSNLVQDLKKDIQINSKLLSEKLKVSNRIIILITVLVVPIAISSMANIVMSIIGSYFK
ncbi:Bdr family repetitive protein [Borreliella garinii]|uniref:Bdr family repetitive protein n=1 Tax=Borreliella garinii TaxID=29519 RepID=UPI0002FDA187|nr:Bdr family repetitive protein [Borreliella garinii]WNZ67175.1 Bdr family repetitive protein [Borreliella garinii]WNZ68173.1 Bdr family repetitive protein [Borreliella garinii]WNZ69173.1 Bdr family repetitive protein [Borreliella garinii]WNZ70174.1 Bdr family repetitive protein [Borreliella garinii]WNZ71177.1 Bdr family repetitive protein [Borreliella garinii]